MNLRKGIALASAALVSTTGLAAFAVTGATTSSADPTSPSASTAATKSIAAFNKAPYGVGKARPNTPLLYFTNHSIHDGKLVTKVRGLGKAKVISLERLDKGYLVGTFAGEGQEAVNLHVVDAAGRTRHLGKVSDSFDINLAKNRIVAVSHQNDRAVVFSSSGKVISTRAKNIPYPEPAVVGFVENDVTILTSGLSGKQTAERWNPRTGKATKVAAPGLFNGSVSPGGSFVVGDSDGPDGGLGVASDPRVQNPVKWHTSHWVTADTRDHFSPDGTRILGMSGDADNWAQEYAVFGVRKGPKPIGSFKAPKHTSTAIWADNDHLLLVGSKSGDYELGDKWIKKCDLTGWCMTVARADRGSYIVVGGGVY